MSAGPHVDTVTDGPEVYVKTCQKTSPVGFRVTELGKISIRTEVSRKFNWIMEVDHRRGHQVGSERAVLALGRGYL